MREHPKHIGDRTTLAVMLALHRRRARRIAMPFGENCALRPRSSTTANGCFACSARPDGLRDSEPCEFATASSYAHLPIADARRSATTTGRWIEFAVYCRETGGVYLIPIEDAPTRSRRVPPRRARTERPAQAHPLREGLRDRPGRVPRGLLAQHESGTATAVGGPADRGEERKPRSVRQQRHRDPGVASEEHAAGDRRRAEAIAHLVEGRVERVPVDRLERQHELNRARVLEVGDGDADERQPAALELRQRRRDERTRDGQDLRRARRRLRQRVRAGRTREVAEAEPEDDGAPDASARARMRRVTRSTSATTSASTDSCDQGERPRARCEPIEPRRRRPCTGRGSRLWASAWRCRPVARPSIATRASSGTSASRPTVVMPRERSFAGGDRADAPEPLHLERVEERELPVRRHDEEPVGLRHAARDLGEELRPRDADRDRQAHLLADVLAAAARRSRSAFPRSAPSRRRRGTPRRSTSPRRPAPRPRRPGRPPCSPPSRPTSWADTTTACGHSRRAAAPPIAVRTPKAFAS